MKNCLQKQKNVLSKLTNQEKLIKYKWLYFQPSNPNEFDFREYDSLKELFKAIYYRNLSVEDAERKQDGFMGICNVLENYNARKHEYVNAKNNPLIDAKIFYDGREMIIDAIKNRIFPVSPDNDFSDAGKDKGERDDEFYTPRELETIPGLSNLENQEETLRDIPDLESEEPAAERRTRIKNIISRTNA